MSYLIVVCDLLAFKYHLDTLKARAVVKVDKAERLAVAKVSDPTAEGYFTSAVSGNILIY
jgi:hypothetical protein